MSNGVAALAAGSAAAQGGSTTLWASPAGSGAACTQAAPCSLSTAVASAVNGDTVRALPGVYDGGVQIDKQIVLQGGPGVVINASSSPFGNGVQIVGPGGSGSTVEGFKIEKAKFEGILVGTAPVAITSINGAPVLTGVPVSDVTIARNHVVDDDQGFGSRKGQCFSTPEAPGDCGEAIHLVSVTDSTVTGNWVSSDAGGILLTDEFGPTSGNTISDNRSLNNTRDCGITLAGHNSAAVNPMTGQPTGMAGVFDNTVEGNTVDGNGIKGQGAGILMGGGAAFAGVYDNVIVDNVARDNGLAGVTLHQHLAGDLNGNVIKHNTLIDDNLDGDFDFAAAQDTQTTGILIASGAPPHTTLPPPLLPGPITGTVISNNTIQHVSIGIWTLGLDLASTTISGNVFGPAVTTHVVNN